MSSTVRWDVGAGMELLGSSKVTISTATTTSFDFGTPDDLNLATAYDHADALVITLTASTAGTTDSLTWVIQDADDSAGSFGTAAAAVTSGTLAVGTGDAFSVIAVKVQPGRPWIRVRVTSSGAVDTFVCHCMVLGVPN